MTTTSDPWAAVHSPEAPATAASPAPAAASLVTLSQVLRAAVLASGAAFLAVAFAGVHRARFFEDLKAYGPAAISTDRAHTADDLVSAASTTATMLYFAGFVLTMVWISMALRTARAAGVSIGRGHAWTLVACIVPLVQVAALPRTLSGLTRVGDPTAARRRDAVVAVGTWTVLAVGSLLIYFVGSGKSSRAGSGQLDDLIDGDILLAGGAALCFVSAVAFVLLVGRLTRDLTAGVNPPEASAEPTP